ncbi:MAG TPA: iron ABC transporter permease [Anaerovoracaceae bacterium]|nr:iron ABC transporter permease [Anaerovoracaceae bacterium]
MRKRKNNFTLTEYLFCTILLIIIFIISTCLGSVNIPFSEIGDVILSLLNIKDEASITYYSILVHVRIPRIICVALEGAALSLCGAGMQGLLRNPLADGSTLGVSAGASLGAILAIAFGFNFSFFIGDTTMIMAMIGAYLSLMLILSIAYKLDYSLATNTIILVGVIFSMFASSIMSLLITFANDKVNNIIFWTMGSLSGADYMDALALLIATTICGAVILKHADELNAFAIGEENARNIGVDIRKTKLMILVFVSILIGVCVSIAGTIGFVGLVIPHITRMVFGPNHKRVLPASLFFGASFLMLTDLISRTLFSPRELPLGVITSLIGSVVFVYIFYKSREVK